MSALPAGGAMAAIEATEAKVAESIEGKEQELSIAAINGPSSTVISGAEEAVEEIRTDWEERGRKTKRLAVSHAFHSPLIEPMLEQFAAVAETLTYSEPKIAIVSNVTGETLSAEQATDPAYWVRHVRQPVRFAAAVNALKEQGAGTYLELGPDPVLCAMAREALGEEGDQAAFVPTLRESRPEADAISIAIAGAHVAGAKLDWAAFFAGSGAKRVPLPTYPFQRTRYWVDSTSSGVADLTAAGQAGADHPLLAAAIEDPSDGGLTLTGRLSLSTHPWLADHAVAGAAILPGTAFLELALRAAEEAGAETIEELALRAQLVLPERGAVAIQVSVSGPGDDGRREIAIHSRLEGEDGEWAQNAGGTISERPAAVVEPLDAWPPEGAEPLEVEYLYDRLAEHELEYGPAFQGLGAAWKDGERIYAEVSLPEAQAYEAERFGIHPALLDSALHAARLSAIEEGAQSLGLPLSWKGVALAAAGARELRVRIEPSEGEGVSLAIADPAGAPLASVSGLVSLPIDPAQLQGAGRRRTGLLELVWAEVPFAQRDTASSEVELWRYEPQGEVEGAEAARAAAQSALEAIQEWLSDESKAESRLALVTEGAMAVAGDGPPDPAAAAIWGLIRSAQSEHPGRFALIDTDGSEASSEAIPTALAMGIEEPQLALREGKAFGPRIAHVKAGETSEDVKPPIDPERTVLLTGGTGGIGPLIARHLVERHGARHLLLVSRSGPEAEGAQELQAELEKLGASVRLAACDVSDRDALAELLASISPVCPLGAVIHAAGAIADGTVETLGPEQIELVFAPKVDAAWNLHELTAEIDLSAFVLFSSVAGTLGGPGQANYAAANVFLDALAQGRQAEGLPATSIAWGMWERRSGMTLALGEADLARMRRGGIGALSDERGLSLFDAGLAADRPQALAVPIDIAVLRAAASFGALPPIFSGLIRVPRRRAAASGSLAAKLATLPEAEHEGHVLDLVRSEVAAVLGHASAEEIEPGKAFQELGFDSLAAVELRNRLSAIAGLRLSATVVFDYPSTAALAEHLLSEASSSGVAGRVAVRAQASEEPIAIVGMACRYPGGIASPEGLWQLVAEGRDGISEFPVDRGWDLERLYNPDPENPGTSYAREGGFLAEAGDFDAEFFSISPREALFMDPQERLLLESCWEALEDVGIDPASLRRTQTGVFAGVAFNDYEAAAGGTSSIVSGRVSYALGLEGPAITVDTACSSSLVAMHLAAQSLRQGECTLALAGGVTVLSTPGTFIAFSAQRGLAPDGRSKSFAEAADGTGWGEGVGVVVLERLSEAERNGHPILATIKGSAVNQDGASNGLTAPNGPSQERVIRQALANARLEPKDVDVVEAHGTGTTLGDPIEAGALLATYGQDREQPLKLGSIKSNIGHTQAAAGVAGVIKMALAMRRGVMPKTLHVDAPSTKVDWEAGEIELLTEQVEWEGNGHPRRAGVSSFGISGTNAHLILEEPPKVESVAVEASGEDGGGAPGSRSLPAPILLALSAKAEPALAEMAERLATHLEENPDLDPIDVAYSLAVIRSAFEHRAVVIGKDREELLASLASLANGDSSANVLGARATDGKLAFLFSGQGSQRLGMGRELYETDPVFQSAFDAACEQLDQYLETPLREIVFAKGKEAEAKLEGTACAQPALFAIEVALFEALSKRGLRPDLLVGHSIGEIAAAHVARVLSLPDAAKLVCARGKLMSALPVRGAMLAVGVTEQEVKGSIQGKEEEIAIAAVNSPASLVLSGTEKAIEAAEAEWGAKGKKTKRLAVSHAFHSPLMEPMLAEFAEVAESLDYGEPQIPIVSNVSGKTLGTEQATDPAYWVRHVRQPVRFADAVETLVQQGAGAFLEIGPEPVLCAMAQETLEAQESRAAPIPTLREGRPEPEALATALATAHAAGAKLDWRAFFKGTGAKRVPLPTYPFQRRRYWLAPTAFTGDVGSAGLSDPGHPLLGAAIEDPEGDGLTLTGRFSLSTHPWLADHVAMGTPILPGAAFLELALQAAERVGAQQVAELALQAPLVVRERGAVQLQVTVGESEEDGQRPIAIHSRPEEGDEELAAPEWICHATGRLGVGAPAPLEPLLEWPPEGADRLDADAVFDRLSDLGFEHDGAFQGLSAAWRDGEDILAEVSLAEAQQEEAGRYGIHPALLEAAQASGGLLHERDRESSFPSAWTGAVLEAAGARELRVRLRPQGEAISLGLWDRAGAPLAQIESLRTRPLDPGEIGAARLADTFFELDWKALSTVPGHRARPVSAAAPERLAILGGLELAGSDHGRFEDLDSLLAALEQGAGVPGTVLFELDGDGELSESPEERAKRVLSLLQRWIAEEKLEASRLILLTREAVGAGEDESPELASAPVWGLVRSAQLERPESFALIDTDGSEASRGALTGALASGETQLALRQGEILVPRVVPVPADAEAGDRAPVFDSQRTVLVTGASSGLGALIARHLATEHGVRHLLLISRSGSRAEGAEGLKEELRELGAEARIEACDVVDRDQLKALIETIPSDRPLGAVVHAAGVSDGGAIAQIAPEQIERVFAPKTTGALNLHELTEHLDLSAFVLFSSISALIGGFGIATYAAANASLDALAQRRRAQGLPATAMSWGLWSQTGGMTAGLEESDLRRMGRTGVGLLTDEQGLALFDAALGAEQALVLTIRPNPADLRAQASGGTLSPPLQGLVRVKPKRLAAPGSLAAKLAPLSESEQERFVLDLVRAEVAIVLGHGSATDVDPTRAFQDSGFTSIAAVELRNRLGASTGLRLPPTVVFDYPNPAVLAGHLRADALQSGAARSASIRATASDEPIAIVGMSCRYPGGVGSPEELWELVMSGTDGIGPFPEGRGWELPPDDSESGVGFVREGGFVGDAGDFDAAFFGIGPREALAMDPQQRLLLEAAWEALEDAGLDPGDLRGSPAGVFAGAGQNGYGGIAAALGGYGLTAGATSVLSGRVSYTLGLEGPAMTVDTACSSSLVAMHLASQALRGGECTLALAGGVTVMANPLAFTEFGNQGGLARDGRSKSFAEAADGVAWSEGVGVLVLERLSEARRNGHPVLALLKGSAVNQDGASNGLTAPNGPSQERVIRQALANARLESKDVDAVEAHGTGTTLGDPIEAGALLATYGQEREEPLRLGSLKSNIGHTQAAAGVAGVIKMVMAMREGVLPKTLHVDAPSSKVDWEAGEIELLTEQVPWEGNGHPRRAGISSFGISGTNAHVIVEEAPEVESVAAESGADEGEAPAIQALPGSILLALSAKAEPALADAAERLAAHLEENPDLDPADVAYSLATTRSAFEHRAVILGADREELLASLASLANADPSPNVLSARARDGKLAYLFTGQGSQRLGMGRELYETDPVFQSAFDAACEQLDQHLETPLREIVFAKGKKAAAKLEDTACAQPALFAIEVALYEALAKRGLRPDLLAGHSIGEIAAAHVAGVLDLADAAKLVAARGRLMSALPAGGAMAAIEATEAEVAESIEGKQQELSLAAINGPSSTVISGGEEAVEEIRTQWEERGRKTKRLAVSHAFHSPLIEPMLEQFAAVAETLTYSEPKIAIVSNVTGETLSAEQATDPAYWVAHVRQPVRFADAVKALKEQGAGTYLELGPDPVLCAMAREALGEEGDQAAFVPTLRESRPEADAISIAIAGAHVAGAKLDWAAFFAGTGTKRVPLPTYPFQRTRYWLDASVGSLSDPSAMGQTPTGHPLLGAAIEDPEGDGLTLTGRFSLSTHPWLADHVVMGTPILPGAAFLELALHTAERVGAERVAELDLRAPLSIPERGAVLLQVSVGGAGEDGQRRISIHSRAEGGGEELAGPPEWTCHASGELGAGRRSALEPLDEWPPGGAEPLDPDTLYDRLAEAGLDYGPAFQGLSAAWRLGEEVFAEVSVAEAQQEEAGRYGIHPALLEAAQASGGLLHEGEGRALLPSSWSGVVLEANGAQELRLRLRAREEAISLGLWDRAGAPLAQIESLHTRPLDPGEIGPRERGETLFGIDWTEVALPEKGAADPGVDLLHCETESDSGSAEAALEATRGALDAIQKWLSGETQTGSRLTLITRGAVAIAEDEAIDPAAAAVWGLARSAQSEHPGRFALIDTDGSEASRRALEAVLATGVEETQLALREGVGLAPRLARVPVPEPDQESSSFDSDRTVLITGGTGGLGALVARHLVKRHGARQLLLLSRSGPEAAGAKALQGELEGLGAEVAIASCDVSDREQLKESIEAIPKEHPLGAVIHCAGALSDATIESLSEEQVGYVFAPKAEAAWHLHELTADTGLSAFVSFSSGAGILGGPGQGNYAAANVFLDALAHRRRAAGLPATSIAWGAWAERGGMVGTLDEADRRRMERSGIGSLSSEQGLALFDAALAADRSLAVAIRIDPQGLRSLASIGSLPPILSGLVRAPRRRAAAASAALREHLVALPIEEREPAVLDLVRSQVAAVLGHESAGAIEPADALQDIGFDSLAVVELRNRLAMATGMTLPATLVFDYPTSAQLATFLASELDSTTDRSSSSDGPGEGTLLSLLEGADRQGKLGEFRELIAMGSRLRATFESPPAADRSPGAVNLAEGPEAPSLLMLPAVVATSGPQEYMRFAHGFRGERAVRVAPHPGFLEGEMLPSTLEIAAEVQAEAILSYGLDDPFALVGYSSGGWITHRVAGHLEGRGASLVAVVLIDPPFLLPDSSQWLDPILLNSLRGTDHAAVPLDDSRLTASMAYFELLAEWRPEELATPIVTIRARELAEGMEATHALGQEDAFWSSLPVIEVPGDHFTMMTDQASTTAQAVRDFLDSAGNP